jgi:hypothetical protein
MGFHEGVGGKVIVYFTDNYMRDPTFPTCRIDRAVVPGCWVQAVHSAASDVWLVGIATTRTSRSIR